MPDALAGLAASAALAVSDIPFNGPISECRVARIDGKYVVNPTFSELEKADIDIMVGATLDNIMMVEGEMDEVQESEMLEAIKVAHEAIKVQCQAQLELSEACGKLVKREYCHEVNDDELRKDVHEKCYAKHTPLQPPAPTNISVPKHSKQLSKSIKLSFQKKN